MDYFGGHVGFAIAKWIGCGAFNTMSGFCCIQCDVGIVGREMDIEMLQW